VGSAIVRKLRAEGYQNLVLRSSDELDLTRQDRVEAFFKKEGPEYVFLAAAKVGGIWSNNSYPADFIYVNLAIQTNIIHASYLFDVKKLLFLGSSCIYPKHCPQPMKEEYLLSDYLEPTNEPYAVAKIAGIKMCQAYNRQYGTKYISVMPTNLYGRNDNFDLESSHVLPALIRKFYLAKLASKAEWQGIRKDEAAYGQIPDDIKKSIGINPAENRPFKEAASLPKIILWGTGLPRREFLYVDDLADACIYLMNNYEGPEIFNVGCGKDQTIRELAEIISGIVDFKGQVVWDAKKPDGSPQKLLDVSKISKLGWEPGTDLVDGIKATYRWYLQNST
jgi:GDP-L-fucose synthase